MASAVQVAKDSQGYTKEPAQCKTCRHYKVDVVPLNRWAGDPYTTEKNRRCGIGGFAVQPTAICSMFVRSGS